MVDLSVNDASGIVRGALVDSLMALAYDPDFSVVSGGPDITSRADSVSGKAILKYLDKKRIPAVVYSEEGDPVSLSENPKYTVIYDDLDGTNNAVNGRGVFPYGPVMGIFDGVDPTYNDCLASGFLDFPSGNLFYGFKDGGSHLENILNKLEAKVRTNDIKTFAGAKNPSMLIDFYMVGQDLGPEILRLFNTWPGDFRCSAANIALVANGGVDAFISGSNSTLNPAKKKTGEEIGPLYLLVKEAGGVAVDWLGNDLGPQKIGMDTGKEWHYIVAATDELAKEIVDTMHDNEVLKEYIDNLYGNE